MHASISRVPVQSPVSQPVNDVKNSCLPTGSRNSSIMPAANSSAVTRPVSKSRTDFDCSHLRQNSSVLRLFPSHLSMVSTPLSSTSTPPTSNNTTEIFAVAPFVFMVRSSHTGLAYRHTVAHSRRLALPRDSPSTALPTASGHGLASSPRHLT